MLLKYTSDAGMDILRNHRLKVSDPFNFNDPYEMAMHCRRLTNADVIRMIEHPIGLERINEYLLKRGLEVLSVEEYRRRAQTTGFQERLRDGLNEALAATFGLIQRGEVSRYFYVACFCQKARSPADEILMWAHYSSGQTGMRFWIDEVALNKSISGSIDPIIYTKTISTIDPVDVFLRKTPKIEGLIRRSLHSKSEVWSYEQEYRVFVAPEFCKEDTGNKYVECDPSWIGRIDFGYRCDSSLIEEAERLIEDVPRRIKLMQAYPIGEVFEFDYRGIN